MSSQVFSSGLTRGLFRQRKVFAGQQRAVAVPGLHHDVALFAEFGEVIALERLHFLCVDGLADLGLHLINVLQSRLQVIFH